MDWTACVLAALAILLIGQAAAVDITYGFWNVKQFGRDKRSDASYNDVIQHIMLIIVKADVFAFVELSHEETATGTVDGHVFGAGELPWVKLFSSLAHQLGVSGAGEWHFTVSPVQGEGSKREHYLLMWDHGKLQSKLGIAEGPVQTYPYYEPPDTCGAVEVPEHGFVLPAGSAVGRAGPTERRAFSVNLEVTGPHGPDEVQVIAWHAPSDAAVARDAIAQMSASPVNTGLVSAHAPFGLFGGDFNIDVGTSWNTMAAALQAATGFAFQIPKTTPTTLANCLSIYDAVATFFPKVGVKGAAAAAALNKVYRSKSLDNIAERGHFSGAISSGVADVVAAAATDHDLREVLIAYAKYDDSPDNDWAEKSITAGGADGLVAAFDAYKIVSDHFPVWIKVTI